MLRGLRVAQHGVIISCLEQRHVVVLTVALESALKVLGVPLFVVLLLQFCGSLADKCIWSAEQNHRVRVDVSLELGGVLLGELFGILFAFFGRLVNFVAILVLLLRLWLRLLRSDEEDLKRGGVAHWVSVKDVTSVLAIVLAESPAEGIAHDVGWNLLLRWVGRVVVVDLLLESKRYELIVRRGLIGCELLELSVVVGLTIVDRSTFLALSAFTFNGTLRLRLIGVLFCSLFVILVLVFIFFSITAKFSFSKAFLLLFPCLLKQSFFFLKTGFLSCTFLSKLGKSSFLLDAVSVLGLLLFVPVLDVVEHLLLVDVRHTVVLGKLSCVE